MSASKVADEEGRKVGRKADDVFADFTYEAPSALAQVRDDSVAE